MLTRTQFVARFPEFTKTDVALVQAKLDEAAAEIDADVWGARANTGHGYLTAHLLALSPMGNAAKLVQGNTTTYETHYARLVRTVAAGIRST